MALCGIKEYDELPARVGMIDVDYLRWRLHTIDNPSWIHKIPILGWLLIPTRNKQARKNISDELDKAIAKVNL